MAGRGGKRPGAGRKPGQTMARAAEASRLARRIVDDPAYQAALLARAIAGTLPAPVEVMLWYQAVGKPIERVEHTGADGGPLIIQAVQYADGADPV